MQIFGTDNSIDRGALFLAVPWNSLSEHFALITVSMRSCWETHGDQDMFLIPVK